MDGTGSARNIMEAILALRAIGGNPRQHRDVLWNFLESREIYLKRSEFDADVERLMHHDPPMITEDRGKLRLTEVGEYSVSDEGIDDPIWRLMVRASKNM